MHLMDINIFAVFKINKEQQIYNYSTIIIIILPNLVSKLIVIPLKHKYLALKGL